MLVRIYSRSIDMRYFKVMGDDGKFLPPDESEKYIADLFIQIGLSIERDYLMRQLVPPENPWWTCEDRPTVSTKD